MGMNKNTERTIEMAKRFFGTDTFTRIKFELYSADIQGSTFWTLYKHHAIVEAGVIELIRTTMTPQEFADMVNGCAGDDLYDCEWHWRVNADGNFEDVQFITVYRMA
jgi:hypothetical protein